MGIKIVSQPVGAPILAAASTAMAQANQRTAERQSEMWQQQVEHKYRTKAAEDARKFGQAEDDFNFGRQQALAPVPPGIQGNLRAAKSYGDLQDEARRIYSGIMIDPRSPEAQKRLKEILDDMGMLRSVNPDPTPAEKFDRNSVIIGPDGKTTGPDGKPYTTVPPGGRIGHLDENGRELPPVKDPLAEAQKAEQEKKQAEQLKRQQDALDEQYDEDLARWEDERDAAKADRDAQIKAERDKENPDEEKIARIREDYRDKWSKKPRRPIARLPELPPVPGAAGPAPSPGIVGPDGTSIVAQPGGAGASSPIPWSPSPHMPGTPTDIPGKYIAEDGSVIYDNVQRYDQYGNPLDREGRPVKIVAGGDGEFLTVPMTPEEAAKGAPITVPRSAVTVPTPAATPIPLATPGSQGRGPASTPIPVATPGSQGSGPAMTPIPIATPGAATPEAMGWDISEWTPEEADIALDKIVAEMEKNGVRYDQLDPATKARFDALVRQKGGV